MRLNISAFSAGRPQHQHLDGWQHAHRLIHKDEDEVNLPENKADVVASSYMRRTQAEPNSMLKHSKPQPFYQQNADVQAKQGGAGASQGVRVVYLLV
jgi:hypothetical protein